jgi:hypothetical protein
LSILLRIRYKPASLLWSHLRIVRSLRIVFVLRYPLVKASFLRTIQITPGSGWSGQNLKAAAESCRRHCVTSLPTQDWSTPEPTYPPCRKLRSRREPKRLRVGCIHWRGQTQDFVAPPLKRTCCTVVDTHELEGRGCVASVGNVRNRVAAFAAVGLLIHLYTYRSSVSMFTGDFSESSEVFLS